MQSEKEQQQKRREDEARKKIESFILNTCYRVRLDKAIRWLRAEESKKRYATSVTSAQGRRHAATTPIKRHKKRATIEEPDDDMPPPSKRVNRRSQRQSNSLSPDLRRTPSLHTTANQFFDPDSRQTTPKRTGSMPATHIDPPPESDDTVFYQLIGECYVHGMMNGEAIDHQNVEELPRTIFEIR
jgi:hypothetical protein